VNRSVGDNFAAILNSKAPAANAQHVYSVRFTARELWGEQASPRDAVYLHLWDDYLEPA
jgi:nitrile hydratase